MYVNFVNDRKTLGYTAWKDLSDGTKIVLIIDPSILIIKNVSLNLRGKSKQIVGVIFLGILVLFSSTPAHSIGNSNPIQTPIERVQYDKVNYKNKVQIAKTIPRKENRVIFKSPEEILVLMYLDDSKLSPGQEIFELLNELRGGSFHPIVALAAIGFVVLILSAGVGIGYGYGYGYINNKRNTGWLDRRQNKFQPREYKYPPICELFSPRPRRTCPVDNLMMAEPNQQSNREELTQISSEIVPIQTQMSGFLKEGDVDLDQCLNELNRRALAVGCTNFECSRERFESLATENNELTAPGAREALSVLNGEMLGYYKNARRENYGRDVLGPDFIVDGIGEYRDITHVEVKNPVGSAIKRALGQKPSIVKQGRRIGQKISHQKEFWSNSLKTSAIRGVNPNAFFPESPDNVLGLVDNYDVPLSEKNSMKDSVLGGSQSSRNIIFLN